MYRLTHLFQKGQDEKDRSPGESEVTTGLERRKKFLRYLNRGWLVLGIVTLVTLPFFPEQRSEFIFLIAVTFPTYLIVRFLNLSGRTRLAGVVFTLCVNFSFYGLFMVLAGQLGANEAFQTQATVWMLMGLAVLFAGAFVDKWAAPGLAAFNTLLLIGTWLLIAPGSDPRPSILVFWWMLALTIWLYEETLSRALGRVWAELTERRKVEMELQESRNFLQQVVDTSPSMIFVVDSMGRAVFVNQYTAQYYGTTPEQMISKSTEDVHHQEPEVQEFVSDDQEVSRTRKRIDKEELNTAPNGELHWFHTVKVPLLRSDGTVEVLGIATDITEHKQAEETLRESEQNLKQAQRIAHVGHWTWDIRTNRVTLSDEIYRIVGLDLDAFDGNLTDLIERTTHPDDMARVLSTMEKTTREQKPSGIEYRIVRPDGAIRHVWTESGDRVTDKMGKILKLSGILQDITERKQAEEEIRRRAETMTALYETTRDLVIERDLSKLLQTIVERAVRLLKAAGGGLYLCEPELGQVRCVVSYNTPLDFTGTVLKYGEGAAGRVAQTMEPLIIDDYSAWEGRAKIYEKDKPLSAVLSVPIKWQNEVIGVIHVLEFEKEHHFTEDDLNLIVSFANQAAIAVQNARMYSLAQQELIERKAVEAALFESEQRFRSLSEAAFEGILIHDQGIIQDANQVFADLIGYRSPEDLIGKKGLEIMPFTPESLERLRRNLRSGLTEPFEITVIRPDGSTYPAETQGRDITFKGRKLRVVAMRDITKRKQTEDALLESRAQLAGIIKSAMDGIITIDAEQRVLLFNTASEKIFGCSASEAIGEPIDRFIPAQFREIHREHIRHFGQTGVTNRNKGIPSVLTGLRANGKEFPIEASISQIDIKGQKFYTVILRDITDRKQAEEKLLASEVLYRRLFEAAQDGILILDAETGEIKDVNPFLKEMLGYSHTEFLGKQLWAIGLFKDIVSNKASFQELQKNRYARYENLPLETKDQRTIWVEFVSNVYDVNGKQVIQCNIRDITARKQAERERENLIAELTAKNAELERFTYTVSHDLKSPLVTIKGFLGYIERDMITGNVERLKDDTQRIANAVDKMAQLLNDLLELSRIGRMMNVSDVIAFDELVSEAMNIVHGQLEAHDVTVRSQPNLPAVYGDKPRLVEVLQNLLDNAVKNMGDQKKPIIEIGMAEYDESGNSVFFVRDNGIGISPEYHERVFGLFNKLDARSEGTGIGLALVKRIIEFHGGRIWVESKLGLGSTFLFTLPSQPKPDSVI